jgi:acid phosphatase (class A)
MRNSHLISIALLVLAATPALALSDKPYITKDDIDIASLLPSPPKETSPAGQLDLQIIADLQKNMTPERAKAIRDDLDQTVYQIAGPVFGSNFTKANFPLTGEFIAKVVKDAGYGVGPVKQKYMKARPFKYSADLAKAFDDIAKSTGGATYPSGHSTTSFEVALIFGTMFPAKRDALYERAYSYSLHRVTSGAAYPSDAEGGHMTATLAVQEMMKKPEFKADFEAVKAELNKGGIN